MNFENKGKWLQQITESAQKNEVRYIDPSNVDKYDASEIEEVTTGSGEKRYRRKGSVVPAAQAKPAQQDKVTVNSPQEKEKATKEANALSMEVVRLQGVRNSLSQENMRIGKHAKDNNSYPVAMQKKVIRNRKKIDALDKEIEAKKARAIKLYTAANNYKEPKQMGLFDSAQRNESTVRGDNTILFDTFGGSMSIYEDVEPYGDDVMRLGFNSSSRGSIYFIKKIDSSMTVKDASIQVKNDKKEIFNALKTLCNDFDNKVKALLKSKGYTLK